MRNLNGHEIGGRTLRVDNACTEKSRLEMQSLMMGMPNSENHYGEAVSAEKAPEAISTAVASLPPEQMYELMKQMKACIQNNPVEARNMLLQNPQLGYALLQAQIVMKIIDPQVAATMLQTSNQATPITVSNTPATTTTPTVVNTIPINDNNVWTQNKPTVPQSVQPHVEDMDLRQQIPRVRVMDQDLRQQPLPIPIPIPQPLPTVVVPVESPLPQPAVPLSRDPRASATMDSDIRTFTIRDPRANSNNTAQVTTQVPQAVQPTRPPAGQQQPKPGSSTDNEKAALIMQVLQLTEEQIAKLPAEQRQSILVLKEQIAKSAQR
ncbi:Hypothetical protein CINCED_3A024567 [Cinara cedri]|nr:Hypothetical protein CINCED_3A024567 [Cinara cedri]